MRSPVRVSPEQVRVFRHLFPFNSRPVQPLNGRQLLVDSTP
jgi:carbonic anhydrase